MVKILLVEDNPGDAGLFRAMLTEGAGLEEFPCEHVDRLSLAIEKLQNENFDIVMLDLSLPDSHGPETFLKVRALFPNLPIVLLTGLNDNELGLKAMREGVQDYLVKGQLDHNTLMRCIRYSIERKQTEKLLASSHKMAALGTMAGGVAHEVNTPLTMILFQIESIRDALKSPNVDKPGLDKSLNQIETTVHRISKIMGGLRTFTREVQLEPVTLTPVKTLIETALADCQPREEEAGVKVTWDRMSDLAVSCRPAQISKALTQLLNNSYDAVAKLPDKWIRIEAISRDAGIELSVTDSGAGISADIIDKLYDPFFTTKGMSQKSGLGLSISRGIITGHEGNLFLDKDSPHTRFVIQLPKELRIE